MEAVGVLAGGIAHDFNNLLTAVMGNAELAGMDLAEDAAAMSNLDMIVKSCVVASDLCGQMLAYAGRGSSLKESIDCNSLVKEISDLLVAGLSKKVTLEFDLHDAPLGIVADRNHMRQVIMNMITNASDAIDTNSGRIVVGTEPVALAREELDALKAYPRLAPGEYMRIRVSDDGAGMDEATQAKIFDPFFTTKSTGHGLGLAAVIGIVRAHNGAISVDSTPGKGTTFSIWLPRVPVESDGRDTTTTCESAAKNRRNSRRRRRAGGSHGARDSPRTRGLSRGRGGRWSGGRRSLPERPERHRLRPTRPQHAEARRRRGFRGAP